MALASAAPDPEDAAAAPRAAAAAAARIEVKENAIGSVLVAGDRNIVRVTLLVADPRLIDGLAPGKPAAGTADPFRGLEAFREADHKRFFGRERLVRRAWVKFEELQRGAAPRILAVLGASGSGKSSLVRAGLLTELARQPMAELGTPRVLVLRPDKDPMRRLADVLARVPDVPPGVAADIAALPSRKPGDPPDALHAIARRLPDAETSRLVLVVDQFEELYTRNKDTAARDVFLENLAHAASRADRLVSVVLTLRSDFAGAVQAPAAFAAAVRDNRLMVTAMSRDELEEAIARPAQAEGHPWPPALVENLVAQAEGRAGALPLLQFALKRLWQEHREGRLEQARWTSRLIEDFLVGAAEELFGRADANDAERASEQRIIRRAFLAMVQFGEGAADTRRVARLGEFVAAGEDPDRVQQALEPFTLAANRLVTASSSAADGSGEPTYELSHEALIASWDRLRAWLGHLPDQAESARVRSDLRLRRRLAAAAAEWRAGNGGVWRPPELHRLLACCEAAGPDLTRDERDFAAASKREWRRARLWALSSRVGAALLAATVAGAAMLLQDNRLHRLEAAKQEMRRLASLASVETGAGNGMAGILLALEAWSGHPQSPDRPLVPEAERALYAAVHGNRERRVLQHPGVDAAVTSVAFGPDGSRILTASTDGRVRLWDAGGDSAADLPNWEAGAVAAVAVAPGGGDRVLAVSADGPEAALWPSGRSGAPLVLDGHAEPIRGASFSPDGTVLATASADGTAVLWDARTAARLRVLRAKEGGAMEGASLSRDLARALTMSEDGKARLWDARTGEPAGGLEEGGERLAGASFTPDDAAVATVSVDGTVRLWGRETGALVDKVPFRKAAAPDAPPVEVRSVHFSASRALLAAAFSDGAARVWRTENGQSVGLPMQETEGRIGFAAFSADETLLATVAVPDEAIAGASAARPVRIWEVASGRLVATLRGHSQAVRSVAFSPDGARLASASEDNTARVWDARASRSDATVPGYRRRLKDPGLPADRQLPLTREQSRIAHGLDDRPFAFSRDGQRLVAASDDRGALLVWDAGEGAATRVVDGRDGHVSALAAHPGRGSGVVTGGFDGDVRLLDLRRPGAAARLAPHADAVSDIRFSEDGARFITASWDGTARLWSGGEGAPLLLHTLSGHAGPVLASAFSPDGRLAATAAADGTARVWDAAQGTPRAVFAHDHAKVVSVAFSPDGQRLLTACWDGKARIWNTGTAAPRDAAAPPVELRHAGLVRSALFDSVGRFAVTVSHDGAAHLWRAADGVKLGELRRANGAAILAAAFLPAGRHGAGDTVADRLVVTAAADGVVEVWAGAFRVAELEGHRGAVTALAFDPAARRLATASADQTLRLWPVLPNGRALVELARGRRTRGLGEDDRARFFLPPEPPPSGK